MENSYKNKSAEQLKSSLRALKIVSITLSIVVILLMIVTIFGMLTKDNKAVFISLFVVAMSCGAILPVQFASMKKIKEELQSREK